MFYNCCSDNVDKEWRRGEVDQQQGIAMQSGPSNYCAINHLADHCFCYLLRGNALLEARHSSVRLGWHLGAGGSTK